MDSRLPELHLSLNYNEEINFNIDNIVHSLLPLLSCVSHEIMFYRCYVDSIVVLEQLIRACSSVENLLFNCSDLQTANPCNFSLPSAYKISLLEICSNKADVGVWSQHPERFDNIVSGISNSELRESLVSIVVGEQEF